MRYPRLPPDPTTFGPATQDRVGRHGNRRMYHREELGKDAGLTSADLPRRARVNWKSYSLFVLGNGRWDPLME